MSCRGIKFSIEPVSPSTLYLKLLVFTIKPADNSNFLNSFEALNWAYQVSILLFNEFKSRFPKLV